MRGQFRRETVTIMMFSPSRSVRGMRRNRVCHDRAPHDRTGPMPDLRIGLHRRCPPRQYTPKRCPPRQYTSARCQPRQYTSARCQPRQYTSKRCQPQAIHPQGSTAHKRCPAASGTAHNRHTPPPAHSPRAHEPHRASARQSAPTALHPQTGDRRVPLIPPG
jgi:hypothetical protein